MINPNVMQAVGEAFDAHHITGRPDEQMSDTVSRAAACIGNRSESMALRHSTTAARLLEANRRAGILSHEDNEPLLNTLARPNRWGTGRAGGSCWFSRIVCFLAFSLTVDGRLTADGQ
jgi:hypothetical protein